MSGILGTLIVLGVCGYLGFYLWQASRDSGPDAAGIYFRIVHQDDDIEEEMADLQKENDRAKYQQLRIKQRALDAEISKAEKDKSYDSRKLGDLYKQRKALKDEISQIAQRL